MLYPLVKFYILILGIVMKGTVSQNFNLGLRFHFIESRPPTKRPARLPDQPTNHHYLQNPVRCLNLFETAYYSFSGT